MNAGIYRLVYNAFRGLWMVVSEFAKSHQPSSGTKRVRSIKHLFILVAVVFNGSAWAGPVADALPNVTVTTGANTVINAPVVNPANVAGRLLTIQQADKKAILQGSSFDIGSASVVNFNHTGGVGSGTLIRIAGPKTTIEGALNAPNGNIYLINQNGILFGNGARVDVNGLVASALNIKDSDFLNDLGQLFAYTDGKRAAYNWEVYNKDDPNTSFATSLVQLEPDARIKAALGGSVMLFAPTVINKGSIETSEGQVVLAAGAKVYLSYAPDVNIDPDTGITANVSTSFATDSPYRGLAGVLVEVDPYTKQAGESPSAPDEITGSVINDVTGRILAQRGNVTMASYMVNQSGRVVATTSVAQKGSIRLLARDNVTENFVSVVTADGKPAANNNKVISATRSGELVFGENSATLILPEDPAGNAIAKLQLSKSLASEPLPKTGEKNFLDTVLGALAATGKTVTDEQIFNAPTLEAIGRTVTLKDGASIVVPGGYINLSAQSHGNVLDNTTPTTGTRLYLGKNTLVDASGLKDVEVSADRNFVEVLLTSNDLQDDPLNKDGFLYHKKVWFDIRNLPDTRVANLAGYIKQIPRSISEKLAVAGKVNLGSEGDIVQRTGSVVDVSGGSLKYTAGTHKETWLQDANGNTYALSKAPAGVVFTGFLGANNFRSSQEHAYVEGMAAGTLNISSFATALDGQFKGGAVYGEYQRSITNLGGTFSLNLASGNQDVELLNSPSSLAEDFVFSDALPDDRKNKTLLSVNMLNSSGFENLAIKTDGKITDSAALNLAVGSRLTLTGSDIAINNNIVARGGVVNLNGSNVNVAKDTNIDVSGLWVNDYNNPASATGRVVTKGGEVNITSSGALSLAQGSLLDVSGGGWLKANGKVSNGDAGKIKLDENVNDNVAPILAGELRGYALGLGGSLDITAPFVTIGNSGFGDARELWLTQAFFQEGGFASYSLTGRDGVLVRNGTQVNVTAKNYQLNNNYMLAGTGSHVADIAKTTLLPDYLRSSTSLSLASLNVDPNLASSAFAASGIGRGSVVVETGALLQVDSHGNRTDSNGNKIAPKIEISGSDNLTYIDGTIRADGGTIAINMKGDPSGSSDNDFDPAQAIWLGSHAKLLAAGYSQLIPNSTGLRAGNVYDGGSVSLTAKKGYIVAESGSLIDVSGSGATLDILTPSGYKATTIASNGGVINMTAREGMLLDSTYKASSPGALGGTLNVNLGRGATSTVGLASSGQEAHYPGYDLQFDHYLPNQQWVLDITQNAGSGFSHGLQAGSSVESLAGGVARVSADSINSGGFSKAVLKSEDVIKFDGDVALNLPSSLRLDAPMIEAANGSTVTLTAPNVMLSNAQLSSTDTPVRTATDYIAPTPIIGTAKFNVNAQLIDLRGKLALSGFDEEHLNSAGDIRLTGFSNSNVLPVGQLRTTGTLTMTAKQVYPTTLSDFTVSVEGAGSRAVFNGTGTHDTVLSAGGQLTVNAENIDQNGVLLAPFGTISLNATQDLSLNDRSLTSVSAEGALIPFGYTSRDGLDYLYSFGVAGLTTSVTDITTPPEKVVKLNAKNVINNPGSVVDVSGGGDLYAYEWVPGVGGSTDVLANGVSQKAFSELGSNATNTWAIMPTKNTTYASFDTQYWSGSSIQAGDAVYLSGVPGLDAGYYTLLPARYALLPGAMLVSSVTGHQDMATRALPQADGSSLVSGHLASYTNSGYVSTSRTGGFVVRAGSDAHKLAEYIDTSSSERFAGNKNVMQTADAGRFSVAATNSLVLNGLLKALHPNGNGAEVDVAAPNLLVVAHGSQTGPVTVNGTTYLAVDENALASLNASSLLLGGTRTNGEVDVISSEVKVGENATLNGPEVILAATDLVDVQSGATVKASGTGGSTRDLTIGRDAVAEVLDADGKVTTTAVSAIDGDGALLRVSVGDKVNVTRNNTDRNRGDLTVESGAAVNGSGAVQLDATRNLKVAGELATKNALTVAAGRISLGAPANNAQVTDGLWLTQSQLDPIQQAKSLTLKSYSTIDLYGDIALGNENIDLTMQGAGIAGYQNDSKTSTITAKMLTLNNNDKVEFSEAPALSNNTTPTLGSGNLTVNAQTVKTGNNTVRVAGFNQTNINAANEIVAEDNGAGALSVDKALTMASSRLTVKTGSSHTISAVDGALTIQGAGNATPTLAKINSQTAVLKLKGSSVTLASGANINAAGAKVTVEATGLNANDNVTLQSGASILAEGSTYTLKDQSVPLSAGNVTLISDNGSIDAQAGSVMSVAPVSGGTAGKLTVTAVNGKANLAGTVHGGASAEALVDVARVDDFSQTLNTLADFSGAQTYRVRHGDVAIGATDNVATKRFELTADAGAINVNGKVDASGDKGGSIALYAKNDVNINRGAQLLAKGLADKQSTAGTTGDGGKVVLSSETGTIRAQADDVNGVAGALIDVSGDKVGSIKGSGGTVILRAGRTAANGVNVDTTATAAITGAANVAIEAVKIYSKTNIDTALQDTIASETNAFSTYIAANPINFSQTRDGVTATVTPGIEVQSDGDLQLSSDWIIGNYSGDQQMPGGGILTLRAAGNLLLDNNLSYEQFSAAVDTGGGSSVVSRNPSWSYRLIAGADANSANPEAVQAGAGSVMLADGKYVRTGSGFFDVVAGQDITLGANAAIYTEGTPQTFANLPTLGKLAGPSKTFKEVYPLNGGEIYMSALGNISGQADTSQTGNAWLYRAALKPADGVNNPQIRWWSFYDNFVNGVGALGGGDVTIHAGGDVNNLQFASSTNGRMAGDTASNPDVASLTVNGGGDVSVHADGSVLNALLVAGKGEADIKAGSTANAKFELMDAKANIYADGSINLTQVSNPTTTTPAITAENSPANIYFYSYGNDSAVNAVSAAGDVTLGGGNVYPGLLYAAAPSGNITTSKLVLYPNALGNATLLAGNDLNIRLSMSDVDQASLPTLITAPAYKSLQGYTNLSTYSGSAAHTQGLLHLADTNPVHLYAGNDVIFNPAAASAVILPKPVVVYAGNDVVDPNLIVQNNNAADVSVIEAGNSIRYNDAGKQPDGTIIPNTATLQVAGPGRLELIASKDIDFGSSEGVRSVGDLYNPYLTAQGADVMVLPGVGSGLDYSAMIAAYLDSATAGSMATTYLPQLVAYMKKRQGVSGELSQNDALAEFKALDVHQQSEFINTVFFTELRDGGRDAINTASASLGNYSRSERAILRMFPNFTTNTALANQPGNIMAAFKDISKETISSPGDLKLFYSQIRSERGGKIEILVPNGLINSGLAVAGSLNKPATDLGIVSIRGGVIDAFVRNDFQVNQSRVFTLGGSDLMLYSALADIDAGRGAKTSSATPPPTLRITNGQITYDYSSAVSGSGIAALTATGGKPGEVDLFAPYGQINAGEAGIRSAGNINLGARLIIGTENISAGGTTTGGPVASAAGLSIAAPASSDASNTGQKGDQLGDAAKQAANNKTTEMPSLITVEVIALGDESATSAAGCKADKDKKGCQP